MMFVRLSHRCATLLALACLGLAGCASLNEPSPAAAPALPAAAPATVATPAPIAPLESPAPSVPSQPAPSPNAAAAVIVPDAGGPSSAADVGDVPDEVASRDLWQRIREGFAMPDLDNELVRDRERYYAARPQYMQRMTERASRYLFHIVEEVQRRGLPTELALLPFIESAFNPQALSSARASGMWQFIPSTGRHYDLKQNIFRDERRDVLASTRAALDYLTRLYDMFGDWHLALAAYNWGEGNVQRAIARNREQGRPIDYESLRMPTETRYYVPKLQAIKNIVARPEAFGLRLTPIENHPYFLTVEIQRDIDVDLAISLARLDRAEFMALNPQLNKPVILAAGMPQILLPYDNAKQFVRNLAQHKGPLASWTAWVVPQTQSPAEIARKLGMSEAQLRAVNKIPPRMVVKAGSTLLVPRNDRKHLRDVDEHIADHATLSLAPQRPPGKRIVVRAGSKDTVASLARRYRVSAAELASWNNVSPTSRFTRGQRVVVYTRAVQTTASKKPSTRTQAKAAPRAKQTVKLARQ